MPLPYHSYASGSYLCTHGFSSLVYLIVCLELQEQQELQNKTESVLNLTLTKWN